MQNFPVHASITGPNGMQHVFSVEGAELMQLGGDSAEVLGSSQAESRIDVAPQDHLVSVKKALRIDYIHGH